MVTIEEHFYFKEYNELWTRMKKLCYLVPPQKKKATTLHTNVDKLCLKVTTELVNVIVVMRVAVIPISPEICKQYNIFATISTLKAAILHGKTYTFRQLLSNIILINIAQSR